MENKQAPQILVITSRDEEGFDDKVIAEAFRKFFEHRQMQVTSCFDSRPKEVLSALSGQKFDAIVLDCYNSYLGDAEWTIADEDWEILERKSKTQNATTPVFALLWHLHLPTKDRMRQLGVDYFAIRTDRDLLKDVLEAIQKNLPATIVSITC